MQTSLSSLLSSSCLCVVCACSSGSTDSISSDPDSGASADASAVDGEVIADSAAASDAIAAPIAAEGTCAFTVDGAAYQSVAGDIFTLATAKDGELNVQCNVKSGETLYKVQLAVSGVTAAATYPLAIGQYSEQSAAGGSPALFQSQSGAKVVVNTLTATRVIGSSQFTAAGSPSKSVVVSFDLALK